MPHESGLVCRGMRLPHDAARHAARPARGAQGRQPGPSRPGLRRYGPAGRKAAGRGGGAGDRPPVAARHPAIRHLRRAGRAASGPGSRQLRHPLCRVSLRDVPPLHRGLPHGGHSARPHDRHGALHRLPHHRTAARRSASTAGSSAATPVRTPARGTTARRNTATRPSTRSSTPGRWMPPHGGSSTRRPSPNGSAERRSCAAVCSGS